MSVKGGGICVSAVCVGPGKPSQAGGVGVAVWVGVVVMVGGWVSLVCTEFCVVIEGVADALGVFVHPGKVVSTVVFDEGLNRHPERKTAIRQTRSEILHSLVQMG